MRVSRRVVGDGGGKDGSACGHERKEENDTKIPKICTALMALAQGWKSVGGKGKGVMVVSDTGKAAVGLIAGHLRYSGRDLCTTGCSCL